MLGICIAGLILHRLINGVWGAEGKDDSCLMCGGTGHSRQPGEFTCTYCRGKGRF